MAPFMNSRSAATKSFNADAAERAPLQGPSDFDNTTDESNFVIFLRYFSKILAKIESSSVYI
jgi:hypothetical protein